MRAFIGLFIAAAVSAVSGTYILSPRQSPYPDCALPCLESADLGDCLAGEVQCLCTNSAFIVSTTQCFQSQCSGADLATAESVARQTCLAAGVTLTSSIAPATSTSPAASSSSSTSSSPSSSPSVSTSSSSNGAASNAVNIVGGVAALGLTALML